MDKAANYLFNQQEKADIYLENGRYSFTSNLSENAIVHLQSVGRTGCLMVSGANAGAGVYTMIEMAKAQDLNVYGYGPSANERNDR